MLFSRVTEAEYRGSGHGSVLPPALQLPRPCSQPRLSPNRGDWAAGGDRSPARLFAALAALHRTTGPGCFQGEAAAFAIPKGKEGI